MQASTGMVSVCRALQIGQVSSELMAGTVEGAAAAGGVGILELPAIPVNAVILEP
jgi:hypothetical protein